MPDFDVGHVVRRRSGGPFMTVHGQKDAHDAVHCVWFAADGTPERGKIPIDEILDVTETAGALCDGEMPFPSADGRATPLAPGTSIRLRSSSTRMTLRAVMVDPTHPDHPHPLAECDWTDTGGRPQHRLVRTWALVVIAPDNGRDAGAGSAPEVFSDRAILTSASGGA